MTVTPLITVSDGKLAVRGRTVLTGVPDNVSAAHAAGAGLVEGAFVGAAAGEAKSHHVFTFGTLRGCRFLSLFRFKLWWMTQRMGDAGRDVPLETQFMLLEVPAAAAGDDSDGTPAYLVMLPLLEGQFRASLQGNDRDELQICIESGDKSVTTDECTHAVYLHAGDDPFDAITAAVKAVEKHLQSFHHREKKKLPSFLDWLGWCTWDAFYTDVTPAGVKQGLHSLSKAGAPPRFLIIDDGWQQIADDDTPAGPNIAVQEGAQFASRLTGIKENAKFHPTSNSGEPPAAPGSGGLKQLVQETKSTHGVKQVYVWHAMAGYWGGVAPAMSRYEPSLAYPTQSPGVTANQPDIVADSLSVLGLGLVPPRKAREFYGDLHTYLASCGVDGVKVDVQSIIETVGAGHGGRVTLTRAYHRALEHSVSRSFFPGAGGGGDDDDDNGSCSLISCMCHNTDTLYSARRAAVVRASDDFYPRDPASHSIHVASVAYNSVFLGEFMQPDWDMFQSLHPAAEYHGAARAVSGGPVYVSDKPGCHDFRVLRKLVLPDGSVLRARLPGRPTRDCLFADPARDGGTLLKVWNANACGAVVAAFNCQGAGWCRVERRTRVHDAAPRTLTGAVRADDVAGAIAGEEWDGEAAVVYAHRTGEMVRLPRGAAVPVTLGPLEYEVFAVCPVRRMVNGGAEFAPVGLVDMFNAGGAVESCEVKGDAAEMRVRGCGRFGAYCSRRPARCVLDEGEVGFGYDAEMGMVTVELPVPEKEMYRWTLEIVV
ncbi:unnamed protein product [Urochloa decumbens]|uniref:galactinol--sucrose galactosyltransferase n=1 Tax=Urochloa decumbens TaxID=240449 RepID=A0ABC9FNR0_9POAL